MSKEIEAAVDQLIEQEEADVELSGPLKELRDALKSLVYDDELVDNVIEQDRDRDKQVWKLIKRGRDALDNVEGI